MARDDQGLPDRRGAGGAGLARGARADRAALLQCARRRWLVSACDRGAGRWRSRPAGALDAVRYHIGAPGAGGELPAAGVYGLDAARRWARPRGVSGHRSDGLEHPAAAALVAASLLCRCSCWGVDAKPASPAGAPHAPAPARLVLAGLAAVLAFAALGKVLSPQYMLWLVPLGALAFAWRMHALAAALAAAALLTQLEFPARYLDLVDREAFPLAVVALRNLALLVALGLALRALQLGRHQHLLDRGGPPVRVRLRRAPR